MEETTSEKPMPSLLSETPSILLMNGEYALTWTYYESFGRRREVS